MKAINTFAVPVLGYSFGIVQWSSNDTEALQRNMDIENYRVKQVETLWQYFYGAAQTSDLHKAMRVADDATPLRLTLSEQDLPLAGTSDLPKFND